MSTLKKLWDDIDSVLELESPETIMCVFERAMIYGDKVERDQHEYYYAAGYVAYMHPEGRKNTSVRERSSKAFLFSLFSYPGYLPSILYLAFIRMDKNDYWNALGILYSHNRKFDCFENYLVERYYEATICCLIECGLWSDALREMKWLSNRKKEDPHVGIDLINFMSIVDKLNSESAVQRKLIKEIEFILDVTI